jgi:serine/threonine-protein kinase
VSYFLHEGRICSLLCHPNIVQTLELGQTGGQYYIAMEHIQGRTLVRLLATALAQNRPFSIPLVVHLATQLTSALEYTHNLASIEGRPLQIVHMDLAPHNIIVSPDGTAKLVDFGISRSGLIHDGKRRDFRGRTAYMAPEILDGQRIDRRVDLFAMGVMLHEMILCRPLFRAKADHQTATRVLYATIPRLRAERPDCPETLERIVLKALQRDPEERYQHAGEILVDLDACARMHNIVRSVTELRAEIASLASPEAEAEAEARERDGGIESLDGTPSFKQRSTSIE